MHNLKTTFLKTSKFRNCLTCKNNTNSSLCSNSNSCARNWTCFRLRNCWANTTRANCWPRAKTTCTSNCCTNSRCRTCCSINSSCRASSPVRSPWTRVPPLAISPFSRWSIPLGFSSSNNSSLAIRWLWWAIRCRPKSILRCRPKCFLRCKWISLWKITVYFIFFRILLVINAICQLYQ